jgi:hypothetical protein
MVSAELEREYARRGVGILDPIAGVDALLTELAIGGPRDAQVIIMAGDPHALVTTAQPAQRTERSHRSSIHTDTTFVEA